MNNTLVDGLQVLELLARSDRLLGVTEMATRLGFAKSKVHRLLQALVELRYVVQDERSAMYSASIKLWELGTALAARLAIRDVAAEAMRGLLDATRESVHLSILDGDEVVYLHKLDSPEPVRSYSEIGGRAPAHCAATGKTLMAWQPEARQQSLAARLVPYTSRTITGAREFLRELATIRANGYGVNRGEWRESVWGIAAPVRDAGGLVVAALGISGPASRVRPARVKDLAVEVVRAAGAVSIELARPGTGRT
jgi:DNA-binding IclR family transcriptional regulator